ncbi:hypothetical protein CHS0354_016051 [Potamilus streckersoni]|uniref:Uncharacterized protein n=1 Tax=Potamilus streckersoni TaxID=2493646 RepID=A0AAE0W4F7_9BIVA|nr:hypothetical protein CHS0354_016051 [Potamilus streckersoni]
MACLHSSIICLVVMLLVSPLAYSSNDNREGVYDIQQRLLQLLQSGQESRTISDDTNEDSSREIDERNAESSPDDPDVSVINNGNGLRILDIKLQGENVERIIQDCNIKYEVIMMKVQENRAVKVCYLNRMDDLQYEASCKENGGEVDTKYKIGSQIQDKTLLSTIEGARECLERPTYDLIPISVKAEKRHDRIRMLAQRQCSCLSITLCSTYCGHWVDGSCQRNDMECRTGCKYVCS